MNDKRIHIRKLKSKLQVKNTSLYAYLYYEKLEFESSRMQICAAKREMCMAF